MSNEERPADSPLTFWLKGAGDIYRLLELDRRCCIDAVCKARFWCDPRLENSPAIRCAEGHSLVFDVEQAELRECTLGLPVRQIQNPE